MAAFIDFLGALTAFSVVVTDAEGRIVLFNPEAARLFGYEPGEVLGRPVELLVPESQRGAHERQRAAHAGSSQARPMGGGRELSARRKDGGLFTAEIALSPFREDGKDFMAAFIVDVTDRRRIERRRDDAVTLASHELRAPITSIGVALSMIVRELGQEVPERTRRVLLIADRECSRLRRLVDDYLSIARIESGGARFDLRRTDLAPLLGQVVDAASALGEANGARFTLESAAPDAAAVVDPDRLTQAVANLLSNAAKFSPAGGTVAVTLSKADGTVRVSVSDRGPGIPAEFRDRIFEKFQQARGLPDAHRQRGSGLGLSIVKAIAERLDGRVGFSDAPGGGTVFFIDLPAA